MTEPSSLRLLTPAFLALMASDAAYFSATGVLLAATPVFATEALGASEAGVGLAMGSFSLTTLVLRPLAGRWTDRHGRRALLVGGAGLFAVAVLGHYLVTSVVMLVALRALLGSAEAMYFVAGFAAAPTSERGSAAATTSIFIDLGLGGGPMLMGLVASVSSLPVAFLVAGSLPVAGAILLVSRTVGDQRSPAAS